MSFKTLSTNYKCLSASSVCVPASVSISLLFLFDLIMIIAVKHLSVICLLHFLSVFFFSCSLHVWSGCVYHFVFFFISGCPSVFHICLSYLSLLSVFLYLSLFLSFIYVLLIYPNDRQSVWPSVFPCLYSLSICPYVITNLCLCLVSLFSFYCSLYYVTSSAFCLRLTVLYPCWLPLPFHLFLSQPHTSFND